MGLIYRLVEGTEVQNLATSLGDLDIYGESTAYNDETALLHIDEEVEQVQPYEGMYNVRIVRFDHASDKPENPHDHIFRCDLHVYRHSDIAPNSKTFWPASVIVISIS